jgi:enterochelin esterase family protein
MIMLAALTLRPAWCDPAGPAEQDGSNDPEMHVTLETLPFADFLSHIYSLPETQRQAAADSFYQSAVVLPLIEADSIVYFLYRGGATRVTIAGDANGWDPSALVMTRIAGTNLYYARQLYEPDARLDYKLVLNNSSWILDPKNPNLCYGGYGPNSELRMPGYPPARECTADPLLPAGRLENESISSTILGNTRPLRIYLPPAYDAVRPKGYPLVLFHDGLEYLSLGAAKAVLDHLIAWQRIEPLIAVFVPPVSAAQRIEEYSGATAANFERFIIQELMPRIDSTYNTAREPSERAMLGPSLAALISAQICLHHPEAFGMCGLYSPAMWPNSKAILAAVLAAPQPFAACYIDVGSYEPSLLADARELDQRLRGSGVAVRYRLWHEGHSWGSWRAHLDESLEFFFPYATRVDRIDAEVPREFTLFPAYPNPFNAGLTLEFALPRATEVSLRIFNLRGEEVQQLVRAQLPPGRYLYRWSAIDQPSGLYIYQLRAGAQVDSGKAILIR